MFRRFGRYTQDQVEVGDILKKQGLKSVFAFDAASRARGVAIPCNPPQWPLPPPLRRRLQHLPLRQERPPAPRRPPRHHEPLVAFLVGVVEVVLLALARREAAAFRRGRDNHRSRMDGSSASAESAAA
ncbi:hypothetical protein ZWY2020_031542 [Hordeum vulgare]|nr:hypothetical protein ZWY2020_031542 [Hordeum vulgare]